MQAIRIVVENNKTTIKYIDNGGVVFSYDSIIGDEYNRLRKYSRHAGSDWMSYVLWCMQCISYVDRIPVNIYLEVVGNQSVWYSSILTMQSYSQFYIKGPSGSIKPCVIIESNNSSQKNERYQSTLSKFKI